MAGVDCLKEVVGGVRGTELMVEDGSARIGMEAVEGRASNSRDWRRTGTIGGIGESR